MVTDDTPPGTAADLCPHRVPADHDCDRCDQATEAAQVARPPAGGPPPRSVHLIVAKRSSNCPGCDRLIIAHQDRTGKVDGDWHCEDCAKGAA